MGGLRSFADDSVCKAMTPPALAPYAPISIVIPTRDRPEMLERAVRSVIGQSVPPAEVIIVDDASSSPVRLQVDCQIPIRIVHRSHRGGAAQARNDGVASASSPWVTFLDDDDELLPNFMEVMSGVIGQTQTATFAWSSVQFAAGGSVIPGSERLFSNSFATEREICERALSIGSGFGFTVSVESFRALGGFDTSYNVVEDTEMIFRLLSAGHRPAVAEPILVRIHEHFGPRMTDMHYHAQRVVECRRLLQAYSAFIAEHPSVGGQLEARITELSGEIRRGQPVAANT